MQGSQNAVAVGQGPPDPPEQLRPSGVGLARRLVGELHAAGFLFSPPEPWRGAGWFSRCETEDAWLELRLTVADRREWFVQVAPFPPELRPTVVRRETIARGRQLAYAVAQVVHASISGVFSSVRWAIDADPSSSTEARPVAPD